MAGTTSKRRFGSVRKLKTGRWEARYSITQNGQRKHASKVFDTREEAERWLLDEAAFIRTGEPNAGRMPLGEYLQGWFERERVEQVDMTTLRSDYHHLKDIIEHLGKFTLEDLAPQAIEDYLLGLRQRGLLVPTCKKRLVLLRLALDSAVARGYLKENPAERVRLPGRYKPSVTALTTEEAQAIWEAAEDSYYRDLFRLYLVTGAREGELLGLSWDDVLWEEREIIIRRTLYHMRPDLLDQWIARHPKEGIRLTESFAVGPPKTQSSYRRLRLSEAHWSILEQHRRRYEQMRRDDWPKLPVPLVFVTRTGRPIHARWIRRALKAVALKAGLPAEVVAKKVTVHALRHTVATQLLLKNIPIKVVAEILGDDPRTVMRTYQHVLPVMHEQAAQALAAIYGEARSEADDPTKEPPWLIERVRALREQGLSLQAIADVLNREGLCTRKGRPFRPYSVARVLSLGEPVVAVAGA